MHINALNKASDFFAKLRGLVLSPAEQMERRRARQTARATKREGKAAGYKQTYCGLRQSQRYSRQVAAGRLKVENGLVVS